MANYVVLAGEGGIYLECHLAPLAKGMMGCGKIRKVEGHLGPCKKLDKASLGEGHVSYHPFAARMLIMVKLRMMWGFFIGRSVDPCHLALALIDRPSASALQHPFTNKLKWSMHVCNPDAEPF